MFKIGTLADWFGRGIIEGLRESQRCGASGVQLYAWNEFDPAALSAEKKKAVKDTAAECGQEIVALCGELGGHGFEIAADNPGKIDYLKPIFSLKKRKFLYCIPPDAKHCAPVQDFQHPYYLQQ